MSIRDDTNRVTRNIEEAFERREAAIYATSLNYASISINYFRRQQASSRYWNNQTFQAMDRMFTDAFRERNIIGWFMAHGVAYGPYLELANNGRNQAIRPIIQRFAGRFFRDVRELFED